MNARAPGAQQSGMSLLLTACLVLTRPPGAAPVVIAETSLPTREVASATRFDVARSYQRLEDACVRYAEHDWDRGQASDIMDEAAGMFLSGRIGPAIELLDQATRQIGGESLPEGWHLADGRSLRPERAVTVSDGPATVRLSLVNLVPDLPGGVLALHVRNRGGEIVARRAIDFSLAPTSIELAGLPPDAYVAEWAFEGVDAFSRIACTFVVSPTSLDEARESLVSRLDALADAPEALREIARARAALITDLPPGLSFAELRFDPLTRLDQVLAELSAIESGRDPYALRAGDTWSVFASRAGLTPLRLYVPESLRLAEPRSGPGVPLVVALHGAGGDENLWMDGYAAGAIQRLADERGFIVASPLAYPFMGDPGIFDDLIADLSTRYPIDPSRIHVIGHSMGGIGTSLLAQRRAGVIASACAIAGAASLDPERPCAPLLVFAAERDRIVPASRVRRACRAAIEAGLPIELRGSANLGHSLVVAVELEDAIDWLLAHQRAPGTPEGP